MESAERPSSPRLPGKLSILDSFFGLNDNKLRLYIALYDLRGFMRGHDLVLNRQHQKIDYQWALLIAPKDHKKEPQAYRYLMRRVPSSTSPSGIDWEAGAGSIPFNEQHDSILVRILVGKITDLNRMGNIFLNFEIVSTEEPRTDETWIRDMVAELKRDQKCCSHLPEWEDIERECMEFAMKANPTYINDIQTLDMISGDKGEPDTKQPVIIDVSALRKP